VEVLELPIDDQVLIHLRELAQQITALQNSFTAQVRSLTDTINENAVNYGQRLTAVERDLSGHRDLDDARHRRFDEVLEEHGKEIETLALQIGKDTSGLGHRIGRLENVVTQAKTARKILVAIAGAVAGLVGWLAHYFWKG
jgi:hypothetical protein